MHNTYDHYVIPKSSQINVTCYLNKYKIQLVMVPDEHGTFLFAYLTYFDTYLKNNLRFLRLKICSSLTHAHVWPYIRRRSPWGTKNWQADCRLENLTGSLLPGKTDRVLVAWKNWQAHCRLKRLTGSLSPKKADRPKPGRLTGRSLEDQKEISHHLLAEKL